jgi:hypothetical protein
LKKTRTYGGLELGKLVLKFLLRLLIGMVQLSKSMKSLTKRIIKFGGTLKRMEKRETCSSSFKIPGLLMETAYSRTMMKVPRASKD